MACETCERMRRAMKRWVARKTGQEWTDGQASATAVPAAHEREGARGQEASDQAGQPAGEASPAHVGSSVAPDTGIQAGEEPAVRVLRG